MPTWQGPHSSPISLPPFILDPATRRITGPDRDDILTATELKLLCYCISHPGEILTRERLYREVWGYTSQQSRSLDTTVRRLRTRIELDPSQPRYLLTVHGEGYRFEPPAVSSHPTGSPGSRTTTPLVGRETELLRLCSSWEAAKQGRPRLILLEGAAGIGKTTLAEALRQHVRESGAFEALASAYPTPMPVAFGPVVALLRALPTPVLQPRWRLELERLLPTGGRASAPGLERTGLEPWRRVNLFEAICQSILAFVPLLLVLDDLQWWDSESLAWLQFLFEFQPDAALLCVGTLRSGEQDERAPLRALSTHLKRRGCLERRVLHGLDSQASAVLVERLTGVVPGSLEVGHLLEQTGGNPLFLREAIRADLHLPGARALPLTPTLEALLAPQLSALSSPDRLLTELLAVAGRALERQTLELASQLPAEVLLESLEGLTLRELVVVGPDGRYDFRHATIREYVARELSPTRLRQRHLELARALERAPAGRGPAQDSGRHFLEAGEPLRALPFLLQALEQLKAVFAFDAARSLCGLILQQVSVERAPDACWIASKTLVELGIPGHDTLPPVELSRLLQLAALDLSGVREAELHLLRGRLALTRGRHREAEALLLEAVRRSEALGDRALLATCWRWMTNLYSSQVGSETQALQAGTRTLELAETAGVPSLVIAASCLLARVQLRLGEPAEAAVHLECARERMQQHPNEVALALYLPCEAELLALRGDLNGAVSAYHQAAEEARRTGLFQTESSAVHQLALLLCQLGRIDEARQEMLALLEREEAAGRASTAAISRSYLVQLNLITGERFNAQVAIQEAEQYARAMNGRPSWINYRLLSGQFAVEFGEAEAVRSILEEADEAEVVAVSPMLGELRRFLVCRLELLEGPSPDTLRRLLGLAALHAPLWLNGDEVRLAILWVAIRVARVLHDRPTLQHLHQLLGGLLARPCVLTPLPQQLHWLDFLCLDGLDQPLAARQALQRAHHKLQQLAEGIVDPRLRQRYLQVAPVNSAILKAFWDVAGEPDRVRAGL